MKRITKSEKEFLLFMSSSSIGTVRINYDSKDMLTASSLANRNLVYQHTVKLPFSGSVEYWTLTKNGWDKCKSLKKRKKNK